MVTNKNGETLFILDDGQNEVTTCTAHELYEKGIQWFASDADNYMPLIGVADNLTESSSLKHFKSEDVLAFAEVERAGLSYRQRGSRDWKQSKKGGDQFLLVTVDGKPYWGDAVGQIPFALNTFRNALLRSGNKESAIKKTIEVGKKYGDGNPFKKQNDVTNTYDNAMIAKAVEWASKAYYKSEASFRRSAAIGRTRYYDAKTLFTY